MRPFLAVTDGHFDYVDVIGERLVGGRRIVSDDVVIAGRWWPLRIGVWSKQCRVWHAFHHLWDAALCSGPRLHGFRSCGAASQELQKLPQLYAIDGRWLTELGDQVMDRRTLLKSVANASMLAAVGRFPAPALAQGASARTLHFVPQANLANFDRSGAHNMWSATPLPWYGTRFT